MFQDEKSPVFKLRNKKSMHYHPKPSIKACYLSILMNSASLRNCYTCKTNLFPTAGTIFGGYKLMECGAVI